MKYKGKPTPPNYEIVVIPRADDGEIVIRVEAVLDFKYFESVCPEPEPEYRIYPDGRREIDSYPEYQKSRNKYLEQKLQYINIAALQNNDDIEWEIISIKDPETWSRLDEELRLANFSAAEIGLITNAIARANGYDSDYIEKAKADFLLQSQVARLIDTLSQTAEHSNTPSGEPAKDLELNRPE